MQRTSEVRCTWKKFKRSTRTRPRTCLYCQGETFQRWGMVKKRVCDPHLRTVTVYRYCCCHCHRTFRHYPEGVDRAAQTLRMRKLAAVAWALGLSYRRLVALFTAFGVPLSRMSAWRDLQARAESLQRSRHWQPVRVLGLDGAYVRCGGRTRSVLVAVDMGRGQPVAV